MKLSAAKNTILKTAIASLLLFFLSLFSTNLAIAQELTRQIREQLEVVTNYTLAANDNTDLYLERLHYERPAAISAGEWKAFPAIRKIEMAYKAAAANNQGNQYIEALSKSVAQEYNSIRSEHILSRHFSGASIPTITFSNPPQLSALERIPVPANVKNEILTVGKYVDEGALGSLQSVMKNYLNLDDAVVYELLARSPSNNVAFEQGLLRSAVPPPHEGKLAHMATDLQDHYDGLKKDARLSEIAHRNTKPSYSFVEDQIKPLDLPPAISPGPNTPGGSRSGGGINFEEFKQTYKGSYAKHANYEKVYKGRNMAFKKMVGFKGGFGGVILGDSIRFDPRLRPVEMRWHPVNVTEQQDHKKFGYLEIRFANIPAIKLYGPVSYEDVFAAYAVVNDNRYRYGNGIGMVSIIDTSNINFSNGSRRFGITLNPAVSHLRLGWAFVIADALATSRSSFEKVLSGNNATQLLDGFYSENNTTWKVSDKKIRIKIESGHLTMEPVVLTMWGFRNYDEMPTRSSNFEKLLPIICSSVDEYKRVNEFTKVFTLFRWAKLMNCTISNITTYNSFIQQPVCIYINDKRELQFATRQEDRERIESEKKLFKDILDFSRNDEDASYVRKIDALTTWLTSISHSREKWWSTPVNTSGEKVSAGLDKEDTTGFTIIDEITRKYALNWTTKCVQLVNPDSVQYYRTLSERVTREIKPFVNYEKKIDSLRNAALILMDSYQLNPNNSTRLKFVYILSKLKETREQYALALRNPSGRVVQANIFSLRSFESRNRVLRPVDLYLLIQAEKKAIRDYFD